MILVDTGPMVALLDPKDLAPPTMRRSSPAESACKGQ